MVMLIGHIKMADSFEVSPSDYFIITPIKRFERRRLKKIDKIS